MLVHRFLEIGATRTPEAVALIDGPRAATYVALDRLANRFGNMFVAAGVARHDRVLIALENSIEMVGAYLGALKAGAVAVPLPAGPRSDRLTKAAVDSRPVAAVIDGATAQTIDAAHPLSHIALFVTRRGTALEELPAARSLSDALDEADDGPPVVRPIDIDLAAIIYTSGSTGDPRGVMLSHRNIVANTHSIISYLGLTRADRVMCVLPFHYVYGLSLLHTHLAVGGSLVIDNRFVFPNVVLRAMQSHAVTGFAGVPSTFALLLHRSNLEAMPLPSLRYVTQAGGPMATAQIDEWLHRGPQVPFYVMYGATEASARLTYLDPARLREKRGSIGKPIPNVRLCILRDDGTVAGPGEVGELVAAGSNIASGYWNNPEETRNRFDSRGYHTGDLGYADDDGYLFLVGRKQDMLKVGANRVGVGEIEGVLHEVPGIHEVAVVGAPHPLLGEVPIAFLSLRNRATADAESLRAFCRSRLPPYKMPVRFEFLSDLPKLPGVGKIDKLTLRAKATTILVESSRDSGRT